jgi:hypothetical protein
MQEPTSGQLDTVQQIFNTSVLQSTLRIDPNCILLESLLDDKARKVYKVS